jgi:hypothetical protein
MSPPIERNLQQEQASDESRSRNVAGSVLDRFAREYGDAATRSRYGLTVSSGESTKSYSVTALGVARDRRFLIVSAPENEERKLIAVVKGQALTCRWFNATTAFRFRATIAKIAFEPLPLLYLELPEHVEHNAVRQLPRALANVSALLKAPKPAEAVIVDLSVGGAKIAVAADLGIDKGSAAALILWPRILDRDFLLRLNCTVSSILGHTERDYPNIFFYGLSFENLGERELLALHAFVQGCLATEFDWLTQVLNRKAP